LGDEIVFTTELKCCRDALTHIWAFRAAVTKFPQLWLEKGVSLTLKATAWLAGFPVTNAELVIATAEGMESLDFVGPSIDLGFRIARFADPHKFVLSADLALMMLDMFDELQINPEDGFAT
jgi:hypothetical protein